MKSTSLSTTTLFALVLVLGNCGPTEPEMAEGPVMPIGETIMIEAPLGLPPVPIPENNPPTAGTIEVGRKLYYDKSLSVDNTIACASCHDPEAGFADPNQFSEGVGGEKGGRQSPPVMNAAYFTTQFWDGRAAGLEEQAGGPVENPVEMAFTHEGVVERLSADPEYVEMFKKAWGDGPISFEMVAKSIASFERTVLVGNSPFDRYLFGGDETAMSEEAIRVLEIFRGPEKGNCEVCHTINEEEGYALFTDNFGTHKTTMVHNWLARRPRYHPHFTPMSSSRINQVERWVAEIAQKQIRQGSFRSTQALEQAIGEDLPVYNEEPKPFVWTKSADQVLESLKDCCKEISDTEH